MTEEWRIIPDHPAYEVSKLGRVRRCVDGYSGRNLSKLQSPAGKILKPAIVRGYFQVALYDGAGRHRLRKVHQLVCEAFIGPRPTPEHYAMHKSDNQLDNTVDNLRWGTSQENNLDRRRHGTMPRGSLHPCAKLRPQQVRQIRYLCESGASLKILARQFGVSTQSIAAITRGKSWAWLT